MTGRGMIRKLDALGHIDRNGNLVWMEISGHEAQRLFAELKNDGLIKTNIWSGDIMLTGKGEDLLDVGGEG